MAGASFIGIYFHSIHVPVREMVALVMYALSYDDWMYFVLWMILFIIFVFVS